MKAAQFVLRAALLAALLLADACGADRDEPKKPEAGAAAVPAGTVFLSESQTTASGIQTRTLAAAHAAGERTAWGRVLSVQDLASARQATVAAASAAATASAQREQADQELARTEALYAQNATLSKKALEVASATAEGARAAASAAQAALAAQRAAASQAWGARLAAELERGGPDLTDLLALRKVPLLVTPGDLEMKPPQTLSLVLGGTTLSAALLGVAPRGDGVLQGPGWLYAAEPGEGALAAGQNVEVRIPVGASREGVLVPREAGIWWRGTLWAYRREAPGRYLRVPLIGPEPTAEGWLVASGLVPGDALVVQGAQLLFSEEMKSLTPASED